MVQDYFKKKDRKQFRVIKNSAVSVNDSKLCLLQTLLLTATSIENRGKKTDLKEFFLK